MKSLLFENVGGNKFKLLKETKDVKESLVASGLKKVFANSTGDISYQRIESVGMGYIKDINTAKRIALDEARILAKEFGYKENENVAKFVKEDGETVPRPIGEEKEEVKIGQTIVKLAGNIKNKLTKHKLGTDGMDIIANTDFIIEFAEKLIKMHGKQ